MTEKKLSLIIPVFNEEENIPNLFGRLSGALASWTSNYEIIMVNDGSADNTLTLLINHREQDNRIKIIDFSRNFGHQAAILAGITEAEGDYIAILDGDLQDPPEFLKVLYAKAEEGYDVVYAVRKKRKEGIIKKGLYFTFYRFLNRITQINIPLDSGDFGLFTKRVRDEIIQAKEHSLFIRGIRSWVGFKQTGIEYERDKRHAGEPKFTFKKLFNLAYNGIFSFSDFPIRILTKLGFYLILISIGYTIFSLVRYFQGNAPTGFTTLAIAIFFFGSVQIFTVGIVGEYVLRTYNESRNRPIYIINKKYK